MDHRARPYRSVLYIPGSKPRALEKAKTLPTDAIIFDLEDAVSAEEKPAARALLAETLDAGGYGGKAQLVRINGFETDWGADDLDAIAAIGPEAILLPKVSDAADIEALARRLDARPETADTRIWAMMETPLGILNAARIAAAPRMAGFVMGTNDLAKELNSRTRAAMMTSLQMCLLAARAHGLVCVDGVYNAFRDEDGLAAECTEGRDFGFDGKTLIHPAQIDIANQPHSRPRPTRSTSPAVRSPPTKMRSARDKASRSWTERSSRTCMWTPPARRSPKQRQLRRWRPPDGLRSS
jgi:(3S)-malyl-CoA thioesterase